MQTIKVDRETLNNLAALDKARALKNEGTKAEKDIKSRLTLPDGPCAFMFDSKVIATQTESFRSGVDLEKLQKDFPKAWAECQKQTQVLSLKVTI